MASPMMRSRILLAVALGLAAAAVAVGNSTSEAEDRWRWKSMIPSGRLNLPPGFLIDVQISVVRQVLHFPLLFSNLTLPIPINLNQLHESHKPSLPPPLDTGALVGSQHAQIYSAVEEILSKLYLDGKACVLRAICEAHIHPLDNYGALGHLLRIFLSPSQSALYDKLADYVDAERKGRAGGEGCWSYRRDCPTSLFCWKSRDFVSGEENRKKRRI